MKKLNLKFGRFGKPAAPETPTFYLADSTLDTGLRQLTGFLTGGKKKSNVILVPMRSLSHETFEFPFSSITKVQTALRLRVMPWAAAGSFEIFPVVTSRTGRGVSGVAWYVSPASFAMFEGETGASSSSLITQSCLYWPAALPLVSAVDGTGLTIFADSENLCALLWQNDIPVLSQWMPRFKSGAEAKKDNRENLIAFFDRYCADQNLPRGGTYILDVADPDAANVADELENIAKASIERCPWLMNVNLSRSALEGARDLERIVSFMTKAACWIFFMGALVLAGNILTWREAQNATDSVRLQSEKLYKDVFEPGRSAKIGNPVTLARDKIAAIQGAQVTGPTLESVLADFGAIFTENPSMDVVIDILRYNTDGMDCTGLASDMSTVLAFRKAWETRASLSQLDNTQSVSNAGYRFDLRVRWN